MKRINGSEIVEATDLSEIVPMRTSPSLIRAACNLWLIKHGQKTRPFNREPILRHRKKSNEELLPAT